MKLVVSIRPRRTHCGKLGAALGLLNHRGVLFMANKPLLYIGAGILLLIGLCLLTWGGFNVVASSASGASPNLLTYGIGFGCVGVLFLAGGAGLIYASIRG